MHLLEQTPAPCLVCGKGNVPRNDRTMPKFLDLERDVNWNDPAIICEDCGEKIGAMFGMLTPDTREELLGQVRLRETQLHDLRIEVEKRDRKIRQLSHRTRALEEAAA